MTDINTWSGATHRLRRQLKTASIAGMGYQFNPKGVTSLEALLTEMATRLDQAVKMQLSKGPDSE